LFYNVSSFAVSRLGFFRRWLIAIAISLAACAWPAPFVWAEPANDPGVVHVVQAGETLSDIAARYGRSVALIARANRLDDTELIWVGQQLQIPATDATVNNGVDLANGLYVVQAGDTLAAIALRLGVSVEALVDANGLPSPDFIVPGQALVLPGANQSVLSQNRANPAGVATYVVQPGDTLAAIAMRLGTTVWGLTQANHLNNPSVIYSGQQLRIPANIRLSDAPVAGPKRVEVDVSAQQVKAWQGNRLVYQFVVSTGIPGYNTRRGTFQILDKIPMAYSSGLGLKMPYWLGIYWAGATENGFHALPINRNGQTLWAGYLGRPVSFGCIVLNTSDAALLYNFVDIGTPVDIHD